MARFETDSDAAKPGETTVATPPDADADASDPPAHRPWTAPLRACALPYGTAIDRAADRHRSRVFWSVAAGATATFAAASLCVGGAATFATSTVAPRLALPAVFLLGFTAMDRYAEEARQLQRIDAAIYAVAAALVGILAVVDGGLASPLVHLMPCLTVAQGIVLRDGRACRAFRLTLSASAFVGAFVLAARLGLGTSASAWGPGQGAMDLAQLLLVLGLLSAVVLAAPTVTDERPRSVGRYLLERQIGDGGMAEVWLGHGPASPEAVAVKVIRPGRRDPLAIMRFGREVAALAELRHESTVRVLDWGVASGTFYYVMELLAGETLHSLVRREGPLRPERAASILREVARAIAEAHDNGIIHRDLKPENIFLLAGDRVKVLDFGVAKVPVATGATEPSITRIGTVVGTPAFMAPEQVLTDPVDPRTDIYGLGATMFFALTGRPPFTGTAAEIFQAHLRSDVPDPSTHCPYPVSVHLCSAVMRCLHKSPARRFGSMRALDSALTAALGGGPGPDSHRPPTSEPPTPRLTGQRRSSLRARALSGAAEEVPATAR